MIFANIYVIYIACFLQHIYYVILILFFGFLFCSTPIIAYFKVTFLFIYKCAITNICYFCALNTFLITNNGNVAGNCY